MYKKILFKTMLLLCALVVGSGSVWAGNHTETYTFNSSTPDGWTSSATTAGASGYAKMKSGEYVEALITTLVPTGEVLSSALQVNVSAGTFGTWSNGKYVTVTVDLLNSSGAVISSANYTKNNLSNSESAYIADDYPISVALPQNPSAVSKVRVTFTLPASTNVLRFKYLKLNYSSETSAPTPSVTFNPVGGTYDSPQTITLTTNVSADNDPYIYFTTDGSDPSDTNYDGYVFDGDTYNANDETEDLVVSSTCTVKARVYDLYDWDNPSEVFSATYTIAQATKYTVTIETPQNGTLVIKNGETTVNTGDEFVSGTVFTAVTTPADGYKLRNWQAVDATTHTFTTGTTYTMGEHDVTFKANFEEIPQYTYQWYVNGTVVKNETLDEGAEVTFPTATVPSYSNKVFVGWVTTETVESGTAPTYVNTTGVTATANTTYYAVFATEEAGGTPTYVKLASQNFDANATYVLGAKQSSTDDTMWYLSSYSDTDVNVSWGVMTTDATNALTFTLSGTASALVAQDSNGNYLDHGAGKFKMSTTSTTSRLTTSGSLQYTSSSKTYTLRHNYNSGNGGLRWYDSSTGTVANFYKVVPGTTYSDYCTTIPAPSITIANNNELAWNATSGSFGFTINNPAAGQTSTTVSENVDWISDAAVSGNTVTYTTTANDGNARTGVITLTYTYSTNVTVIQQVTVSQAGKPQINANDVTIESTATSGEVAYSIVNPITGTSLTAATTDAWISNVAVDAENSKVTFNATANTTAQRTATITLTYGTVTKNVTVTQAAATVAVNITAAGMATFSSDKAVDFTNVDNIYAYTAAESNGKVTYTRIRQIPANTGVLLRNPNGAATSANVPVIASAADVQNNAFVAVLNEISSLATETVTGKTNYILNNGGSGIGFYKANNKTVGAGKAYLQIPTPSNGAKVFIGFEEEGAATAIETINNQYPINNNRCYNLNGQQVSDNYKGIVIVNGKKVMNK